MANSISHITHGLSPRAPKATRFREIERLLGCVRGVMSARLNLNSHGGVEEVSLVARDNRAQGEVLEDVLAVFQTQLGIEIEPAAVKMALVYQDDQPESSSGRLRLERITGRQTGEMLRVAVQISGGGQIHFGWAEGRLGQNANLRLVSGAALQAIGNHLGNVDVFALEKIVPVDFGDRRAIAVSLAFRDFGGEEFFDGLSTITTFEAEAAARATLDAVNRRVRFVDYTRTRRGVRSTRVKGLGAKAV